jgi:uncharacterized membrane protein
MTLLYLGIALWCAAHLFKRVLPTARAGMTERLGEGPAKGVVALALAVSLVLMIIGYRGAGHSPVYTPMAGAGHLNNLLMLVSVILLGAGSSKGRIRSWLRHPMLTGVIVWSTAHLIVNGDYASVVLFGAMAVWAVVEMTMINYAEPDWKRPEPGPLKGDIRLLVISAVVFAVIAGIHTALGYNPFLGTYG